MTKRLQTGRQVTLIRVQSVSFLQKIKHFLLIKSQAKTKKNKTLQDQKVASKNPALQMLIRTQGKTLHQQFPTELENRD